VSWLKREVRDLAVMWSGFLIAEAMRRGPEELVLRMFFGMGSLSLYLWARNLPPPKGGGNRLYYCNKCGYSGEQARHAPCQYLAKREKGGRSDGNA